MSNFLKKRAPSLFWFGLSLFPLTEIYRSFFRNRIEVLDLALEDVLLLSFWLGLYLSGLLVAFREKRKKALFLTLSFTAIFLLYLVLHAWNASRFDPALLPEAEPSFLKESYYLIRVYFTPISMIFSAFLFQIPTEKIHSAVKYAALVLSLCVLLPCLTGISFASYVDGNEWVDGSFFSWFSLTDSAPFHRYTAKGLFSDANAVGILLFALSSVTAAFALKKGKGAFALFLAVGFSAVAVGTKVSSFGFFLSSGAMLLCGTLSSFRKKDEVARLRLGVLVLCTALIFVLFLFSPGRKLQLFRKSEEETANRDLQHSEELESVTSANEEAMDFSEENVRRLSDYIRENYWDHFIDPWFLEVYPVAYDPVFWQEIISRPNVENADSRSFKLELANRILARNENPTDRFLGYGACAKTPYAERDYLGQLPLYGIFGLLILIAPYFAVLGYGCIHTFFAWKKKEEFLLPAAATLSLGAFLSSAYFSGHVFDTAFSLYYLAASTLLVLTLRYRYDESTLPHPPFRP